MDQEAVKKFNEEVLREALSHTPDFMNAILFFIQFTTGSSGIQYPTSREKCSNNNCNPIYTTEPTATLLQGVVNQLKGVDMMKLRDGDLETTRISLELLFRYRNIINEKRAEDCLHYSKEDRRKITPFIETSIECLLLEYKEIPTYLMNRLIQSIIPIIMPIIMPIIFSSLNTSLGVAGAQQPILGSLLRSLLSASITTNPTQSPGLDTMFPVLYQLIYKESPSNMSKEGMLAKITASAMELQTTNNLSHVIPSVVPPVSSIPQNP